jgi:hypothetical protein
MENPDPEVRGDGEVGAIEEDHLMPHRPSR